MASKNNLKDLKRSSFSRPTPSGTSKPGGQMTEWFTNHISRRTLGKGLAWGAVLAMAGVTVYQLADDDAVEVDEDSFALQKKEGWNVGSTDKSLTFEGSSLADSRGKDLTGFDPNY